MSNLRRGWVVYCDKCGSEGGVATIRPHDKAQAIDELLGGGWVLDGDKFFCPGCVTKQPSETATPTQKGKHDD